MESDLKDKRFKHAVSDPRFKNVPWKERKVQIDRRFQSMFTDKRFQMKYAVDERGRPVDELQSENYKKYYDLSDSSVESDSESVVNNEKYASLTTTSENEDKGLTDDEESNGEITTDKIIENGDLNEYENIKAKAKLKEAQKEVNKFVDENHKRKLNSEIRDKLADFRVDYARGIGTILSESSSDESSSDESEVVNIEHPWGELDRDADVTNEATSRLAVCNMDWDRVTATDLMVLFHSFLPPDGVIESVIIYPSEFGLARMAEEEHKGPKELVEIKEQQSAMFKESDEVEEGSTYQREKLREYQLKRLKYYYAVITCNSKETGNALYTECDGIEYESSAMKLDLRFIGDDVTFEQKPHDKCTILPDLKKYKPRLFVNTALQQGKVDLTWDETDPNRIDFSKKLLAGEVVDDSDLKVYVANSSSEEEEEETNINEEIDSDDGSDKEDHRIKKYRDLVVNLEELKSKKRGDVEMEVTWGADAVRKENPLIEHTSAESIGSNEDFEDIEDETKMRKPAKNIKKTSRESGIDSAEEIKKNAELELLLADDYPAESGLKHFSLKEIQKMEKQQKKKKKWQKNLKKKLNYQEEDAFKMNPSDERFSAIYTSHQFNIDPADPHFRKTKGMEQLIDEKQKRRKLES